MADRALDDPALTAQAGSVLGAASGDDGGDPARPESTAVGVVVIATVGQDPVGLAAWTADPSADRRSAQRVDQGQQLGDVVAVPGAHPDYQRHTRPVGQRVGLDAPLRAIGRARAGEGPPKTAR